MDKKNVDLEFESNETEYEKKIRGSYWLLLYCISEFGKEGGYGEQIDKALKELVQCIRQHNNKFCLMFSYGYDLHDSILLFAKQGYIRYANEYQQYSDETERNKFILTTLGKEYLLEYERHAPAGISLYHIGDNANELRITLVKTLLVMEKLVYRLHKIHAHFDDTGKKPWECDECKGWVGFASSLKDKETIQKAETQISIIYE